MGDNPATFPALETRSELLTSGVTLTNPVVSCMQRLFSCFSVSPILTCENDVLVSVTLTACVCLYMDVKVDML